MKAEATSTCQACGARVPAGCQACGARVPAGLDFCPVCALRGAVDDAGETSQFDVDLSHSLSGFRFDHYEILTEEDATPLELGRGAMGVTYKAIDINLQCAVALKVINARFIGDQSARRRFVQEARAAASVRHPNVASVFHLGQSGDGYFYAMEFVEGETLENVIKRTGQLELKLVLEIAVQVASGLAAVHKAKLVHRDIKPSNIMVSLEEGGSLTAKIIDLGLAKVVGEAAPESAISASGAFAGTPEFASPEQFAGVGVDIRSDLYSLGVVLWEMLTGRPPFRGTPAELIYQHQHGVLPLKQLKGVPPQVTTVLKALLDKDPKRRFETPVQLLKTLSMVRSELEKAADQKHEVQKPLAQKSTVITERPRPEPVYGEGLIEVSSDGFGFLRDPKRTRKPSARSRPKKISVARLPVTGSELFGREEDIAFLDDAWANKDVNVVTIVAWAGVGKSTLINHWLRRTAADHYRSAELIFAWSFYRQGTSGDTSSADEFLDAALDWFGDPDPRIGTAWEKGERLAKLVAHRRTLLVLDGLEPLQNPPGPQEGRLREPSLQALLRELAAFNMGLCVIATRMPVADIADHEHTSAPRRDLNQLSSEAGAKLLRALGVKGDEAELRSASGEFHGHCLALTLLGSYLTDAYNGEIRCRKEVSTRLAHDLRQGAHARKVMESYQRWLGEGPELAILRMLGLFDRPADEQTFGVLLKSPAIPGLTESLTDLSPSARQTILARLRRARLLAGEDRHNPGQLDTHPLVREYFGEQLRSQQTNAWKECNRRLYVYYRTLAPQLPSSFREMEPLFSAVICGCNAGLFREALHEVYIRRIQRGDTYFAAKVLGATGPLLTVLVHFFEHRRWGSLVETAVEGQSLTAEDRLFILMQAAAYLTAREVGSPEARICYVRAEPLCHSLGRPLLLHVALIGQWRYSLHRDKLTAAMQIAERIYSLAQEQDDATVMIWAYNCFAATLYFLGDFEGSRQNAMRGIWIWRSGNVQSRPEDVDTPVVSCLGYKAYTDWHLGEIASCQVTITEAISLSKELNDENALAIALNNAAILASNERNPAAVDRWASDLIELSTRHNFLNFLALGTIHRGWARSASGDTKEGISWIERGITDLRAIGAVLGMPIYLARKAETLHLADRTSEALEAINEAEALAERFEQRDYYAELHRLRGVFLAALGADETRIEASLCTAIRIAKEQKSVSLEKRAEATYAEYRRQKASASGGRGYRLPLW